MNVKMRRIRKPAKRIFSVTTTVCLLVQFLFAIFVMPSLSTSAEGYSGNGMTASLDGNGNLILSGQYSGNPSNLEAVNAYELPIYQDENSVDFNNMTPIASYGAAALETFGEFESASLDGWAVAEGITSVQSLVAPSQVINVGQSLLLAPSGGHFLQATGSAVAGESASVKKHFDNAVNLTRCKFVSFYFQGDGGTATQYTIKLTLTPVSGTPITYSVPYTPSTVWTSVQFDISEQSNRDAIQEIAISYEANADWNGSFRVDSILSTAESRQLPVTLDPLATTKIADFSNGSLDGFVSTDTATVAYVTPGDASASGNEECLDVARTGLPGSTTCYTMKEFAAGSELDLGGYNLMTFYVNSWGGLSGQFVIDLILTSSDGSTYQKTQAIEAGDWQILAYDISEFESRDSITSIKIGFACQGDSTPWGGKFYIDDIYAHANIATVEGFEYKAQWRVWQGADHFKADPAGSYPGVTGGEGGLLLRPTLSASQGDYAYVSARDLSSTDLPSTIKKTFVAPMDLSRYSLIAFDANAWMPPASPNHHFHLMLESGTQVKEYSLPVTHTTEDWHTFIFDISDCEFRNNITAIKIGWSFEDGPAGGWDGLYYIDNIRFGGIGDPVEQEEETVETVEVAKMLFDFEDGTAQGTAQGWIHGENINSAPSVLNNDANVAYRHRPTDSGVTLVGVRDNAPVGTPSTLKCDFSTPLDLSDCTEISFDVSAKPPADAPTDQYRYHLYLQSGDQIKEYSETVTHIQWEWHTLTFDITDCEFRDSITTMKLGFSLAGSDDVWEGGFYYFDNIRTVCLEEVKPVETTQTLFDFEGGNAQGWTLAENSLAGYGTSMGGPDGVWPNGITASEGEYCIVGVRDGALVEVPSTLKHDFSTPLDLSNYTTLTFDASAAPGGSLTNTYRFHLYLQSGDQVKEYSEAVEHTAWGQWHTLTFDITDCEFRDSITTMKLGLSLEGGTSDPSGTWWQPYYFDNIRITGVEEKEPSVAYGEIDEQGNIKFTISLNLVQNLESKFAIVTTDQNGQSQMLGAVQYVSDFSSLSAVTDPFPMTPSIKGIGHVLPSDNERLGSNNSGMNIDLGGFTPLATPGANTITYTYKGKAYYFNKSTVQHYDDYVRTRSTNGEIMYAILILPVGSNSILVHPKADKQNHVLSMVNLNNQDCVDLYSAIISFIANRYNGSNPELGRICDYIVGNEIGNSYWNSMGDAPMDEYVKEYERWLRLTNALVKQAWSNARVFASFDYNWAEVTSYSQPELLKQLDRLSKAGGDYDWNVAWHAYPANLLDSETTWNAPNCTDNINTSPIVTWKNLQLLPQFLRDNNIAFNGNTRRIILSEQGFHSKDNSTENQKIQAAAFAYAYYKALSLPEIDYFCLRDGVDHSPETESGLQLGIWTMIEGQEYQPDQQKLIYDVVKYIDTVKSLDATRFVFDVIPDSFGTTWEELVGISEDEIRALCTLPVVETGQTGQLISSGESTTLSAGTTDNWLANDSTSDLTVIHDESLDADVLSMNVFGEYCKDFKGATYTPAEPLDLTGKLLFAKVKANAINANQQMEYMIRAYSGNQVIEGSYEGPAGEWKTVAMDVSSFTGKASVDHIKVWARPTGSTIWTDGSLEIASLSTAPADGADMRNVQVTLNTNTVRREGAEVRVTITNNNGKTVSGDVTFQGVNGLEFDKATQAVTLSDGQSVTIPLKVTKFDVEVMKAGQLAVEFYGLRFEFTLTGLRYPDYTMDGDNMIFGDFEGGLPDGWIAAEDVDSAVPVEHGTQYSDFPAQASKGTYLLEILKSGKVASTRSYVEKIFFEPVDLSEYQTVHVDWAGWGGISYGERYGADLILNFVDGTSESVTKYVTATKEWTKLVFDISEFANRGKVESIKIGYFASGTLIASTAWSGYFFIDNIYASPTGGSGASGGSGGAGDIEVPVEVTLTDNESNVSVSGITVRSDTTLEVTEITDEEDYDYQLLRYAIRNLEGVETAKLLKIEVLRDGMPYPLNGEMTISINRPDGFADKTMVIAHIRGDGSVTYIIPEEKDGKLIFKTDSLISSFGVLAADSIWEFDGVQPPKDDNSATGVTMGYLGFLIPVACIATAVVIATSKRRRIKHSR